VEVHLANSAEGADPEAQAYLSELLDLHMSLDWAAAGPYGARRVDGEDDGAARAFFHCDKRLVEGRIGLHDGLGDPSYPYTAGVTATSAPPESGRGAPGAVSPHQRKRTQGVAERPPARGGPVRRISRAGPSPVGPATSPTLAPPGVSYHPALGARPTLSWGYVTPQCPRALATTYPTAAGTLRVAHGQPIVASLMDTLAWVTRGAGAVLRGSPSPFSAAAEQFLVDTTPEAIGYQMASRLEGHGQRVAPGSAVTTAGGSSTRAPYAGEPAAAAAPYFGGGYSYSAGGTSAAGHTAYAGGYTAAATAPSAAPRSTWGPVPTGRGPAREYPFDPPVRVHHGGYARDDLPRSPDRGWRPVPWRAGAEERRVRSVPPPSRSCLSLVGLVAPPPSSEGEVRCLFLLRGPLSRGVGCFLCRGCAPGTP